MDWLKNHISQVLITALLSVLVCLCGLYIQKVTSVETRTSAVETRVNNLEKDIARLQGSIDSLRDLFIERTGNINNKLTEMREQLTARMNREEQKK